MNKTTHQPENTQKAALPGRISRQFAQAIVPFAFTLFLFSSCSGLWTSLQNPVDPKACEVDLLDPHQVFNSDDSESANIDPVLENLRQARGFQVLYVGFNTGTYTYGNTDAPFVMITTKYIAQTHEENGITYANFPLLDAMTITDSLGAMYTPWIRSTANGVYHASDGSAYDYEVSTFGTNPTVVTSQTYYVNISATNVAANDGTPLDRPYSFVVRNSSNANTDSAITSTGLMDGLTTSFSSDFSVSDPYWEWSKDSGSGSIDGISGKYCLTATGIVTTDGYDMSGLYCKRYPYVIKADTFAVCATNSSPGQNSDVRSGLYLSDSSGHLLAAIMLKASGSLECFGPGQIAGVLQMVKAQSVQNYDNTSTVLGLRQDGGRLYFYVNGECVAFADKPREKITNAGLFILAKEPYVTESVAFDDFAIAQ